MGIAQKAQEMGKYYGWDNDIQDKLYFVGALHDIGKLIISTDILEKPGKLTENEYSQIQNHAMGTYYILHTIPGIESKGTINGLS